MFLDLTLASNYYIKTYIYASDYPFGILKLFLYNCDHRTSTVILSKSSLRVYSSCIVFQNLVFSFPLQKQTCACSVDAKCTLLKTENEISRSRFHIPIHVNSILQQT
jgi:hypothetical protein